MYEVQQRKHNITIKTTKYLGVIRVIIQHACNKITVRQMCWVFTELHVIEKVLNQQFFSITVQWSLHRRAPHEAPSTEIKTWHTAVFFKSTCCSALVQSAAEYCSCYFRDVVQETSRQHWYRHTRHGHRILRLTSFNQPIVVTSIQLLGVTLQFNAGEEQRDTAKDVLLFLVQHSGTHSHCLFVIDHWHWLSSVRVWRLCYSAEQTKH